MKSKKRVIFKVFGALFIPLLFIVIAGMGSGCNKKTEFETTKKANESFTAENALASIFIETDAGTVNVLVEDIAQTTIEYYQDEKISVSINESPKEGENDRSILTLKQEVKGYFMNYGGEIIVKIPKNAANYTVNVKTGAGETTVSGLIADALETNSGAGALNIRNCILNELKVDTGTGDVIVSGSDIEKANISANVGSVKLSETKAAQADICVDTGSIDLTPIGIQNEYTLTGETKVGKCNFQNAKGSTEKYINAKTSVGSITLTFIPAN